MGDERRSRPDELFPEVRLVYARAAELVAAGWCQGAMARGRTNRPCNIESDRAVSFCAEGAIRKAARDLREYGEEWFTRKAEVRLDVDSLTAWNDERERTQREVVGALQEMARVS